MEKSRKSSSESSGESDGDVPNVFVGLNKNEMLRRIEIEDEIFSIRQKMADIRRERTYARLAKPRTVRGKHVDKIKSAPEVRASQKMRVPSERINRLAVPR